jgi:hypothetical protein
MCACNQSLIALFEYGAREAAAFGLHAMTKLTSSVAVQDVVLCCAFRKIQPFSVVFGVWHAHQLIRPQCVCTFKALKVEVSLINICSLLFNICSSCSPHSFAQARMFSADVSQICSFPAVAQH